MKEIKDTRKMRRRQAEKETFAPRSVLLLFVLYRPEVPFARSLRSLRKTRRNYIEARVLEINTYIYTHTNTLRVCTYTKKKKKITCPWWKMWWKRREEYGAPYWCLMDVRARVLCPAWDSECLAFQEREDPKEEGEGRERGPPLSSPYDKI